MVGIPLASVELAAFGAAKLGLVEELEACLKQGAPVNATDADGRACLHYVAGYGFEQAMDVLLGREDIQVDAADKKGDTPLHLAAAQGHPMCAFNLTKAHPRGCLHANTAGQSPLDIAVSCDRGEVLNAMLLACAGIKSEEALQSIAALLQAGAVPDTWAPNGSSALMLAAAVDSVEAIKILLDNGATVELQDALGRTALMFATGSGAKGALRALLDAGASLAARDRRGKDILDYAPEGSDVRVTLQDRLRILEKAAEEMQAVLLASIAEEAGAEAGADKQAKAKRKGGKKGKRSRKSAAAQGDDGAVGSEEADPAGASGRDDASDGQQSEEESGATAAALPSSAGAEAAADAQIASAKEPQAPRAPDSSCHRSQEDDWKVVGKPAKKPQSMAPVPPSKQQHRQPAAGKGAIGASARAAPHYKRCPSVTSLSDSTCSAESDQSMASASGSHASSHHPHNHAPQPAPAARPARPGAPPSVPLPSGQEKVGGSHAPPGAAVADGRQRHASETLAHAEKPSTWAGKVAAAARGRCDASDSHCAAPQQQPAGSSCKGSVEQQQPRPAQCEQHGAELAAARAAEAAALRESAALAAEVERLRSALALSEAARQQEVARLLQNAAQHEAQAVEQAVQAERAAMAVRLLTTFESLKAMAQAGPPAVIRSSNGGAPAAAHNTHVRGAMATLLGVQPGEEPSRAAGAQRPMYNSCSDAAPFTAFGSGGSGAPEAGGAGLLGSSLSSLVSSYTPAAGEAAAAQPVVNSSLFGKPELKPAKSCGAKPFSFFNSADSSSIWS